MKLGISCENFQWIGEGVSSFEKRKNKIRYEAFCLGDLIIRIGDFVLIRNDDALDPDDVMNCFVAQVKELFDTGDEVDPYQAQVQWFSKVLELPAFAIRQVKNVGHELEVVKDKRSNWHDIIDAETIFQKCEVLFMSSDADYENILSDYSNKSFPVFFCRYAFTGISLIEVKDHIQMPLRSVSKNSSINGLVTQDDVNLQKNVTLEINHFPEKTNSMYCAIPVGSPTKCPKVLIKKIDDKILESKNGNVRIFVANSKVENIEDVADIFLNKLKLEKQEEYCNEKNPIIHSLTSQNGPEDISAASNGFMDYNSTVEYENYNSPKTTKDSNRKNATPLCSKLCKNLFAYNTRNSPKKNVSTKHDDACCTPTKKIKVATLDDLKLVSSSEKTSNSFDKNVTNFALNQVKYKNSKYQYNVDSYASNKHYLANDKCETNSDTETESLPEHYKARKICPENRITPIRNKSSKKKVAQVIKKSPNKSAAFEKYDSCSTPKKKVKTTDMLEDFCLTRSGRRVKSVNYSELVNAKKIDDSTTTPKKKLPHYIRSTCSEDSDSEFSANEDDSGDDCSLSGVSLLDETSPKKIKQKKNYKKAAKTSICNFNAQTPTSRKSAVNLCIPERKTPLRTPKNALEETRQRLHVSSVPNSLPCRDEEYSDIYSFVKGCLCAQTGGCMYISGVPGTGKTATVHEVMRNLEEEKELGEVPIFSFVEVNGMWMTDPYQCYVQIFKALTEKTIAPQQAADLLEKRFTERGPKKDAVVLLVDELDRLWTRKQTVMYNIFDWPSKKDSKLIVLAIANTMDLPERMMMNRISSRLGLTRKTFQPYTFKQLQEIIMSRIQELKVFDPDAVQLVARKVAAVSGDARRALDICRFATETVKLEQTSKKAQKVLIGMDHVDKALQQMFSSPVISAIRSSSKIAKLFFQCILSEFTRTGLEETTLLKVHQQVICICRFEGLHPPNSSAISRICADLAASHLILVDNFRNDLYMKIRLNVSSDDVTYALMLK